MIPWHAGRHLVWDATVADTLASSYVQAKAAMSGAAAEIATERKKRQVQRSRKHALLRSYSYGDLRSNQRHWPELSARPIGGKLTTSIGDNRETCFLLQRLSITIQRFNSVAFRGTLPEPDLRESQL